MIATYTTPERFALLAAGLLLAAVAAFGAIHVAPNRHLFPQNEIVGTVGLYWAATLLAFGVWMIADWRRKGRAGRPWKFECVMPTLGPVEGSVVYAYLGQPPASSARTATSRQTGENSTARPTVPGT